MAVAQYIAGMAFSNVGLGVVHGMAHPLGAIFDIPHGVANALLLPVIMEFNAPAALPKYVDIAKAMNVYLSLIHIYEYMSILIHVYIINRYTPPASARITPFISPKLIAIQIYVQ